MCVLWSLSVYDSLWFILGINVCKCVLKQDPDSKQLQRPMLTQNPGIHSPKPEHTHSVSSKRSAAGFLSPSLPLSSFFHMEMWNNRVIK